MKHERDDLLRDGRTAALIYGLPAAAIVVSGALTLEPIARGIIWALALLAMSAGCLVNALRCSRVHCYFTAPFLFAMAIASAVYGALGAHLGARGWNALAAVILVGSALLYYVPERLIGRYRGR